MKTRHTKALGLVAVGLVAALAPAVSQAQLRTGHRLARTTVPTPYDTIKVTMTDSKFTLSKTSAPQDWDARFVITNKGTKPHSFELNALGGHVSKLVKPGQRQIVILFLNHSGVTLHYLGNLPADRKNAAMQGTFKVVRCRNPYHVKNQAAYNICKGDSE